jgi:hypothetical protein
LKFSPEEDAQLADLVRTYGDEDWVTISCLLPGRNARQCRERWHHYVCPTVSLAPFTPEEDARLLQKFAELGPKWKSIAVYFDSRTDITLKNRLLLLSRHRRRAESAIADVAGGRPLIPVPVLSAVADPQPPPAPPQSKGSSLAAAEIPWSDDEDPRQTFADSTELGGDYFCLGFQCLH